MADEHYIVMTVECQRCKTKQKVHVATQSGVGQMSDQTIRCIKCDKDFDVLVPDKILRGPFPA
jgi:phage FluMu protein Com